MPKITWKKPFASLTRITEGLPSGSGQPTRDDIHALHTAANQARQATMNLDMLLGMLENEFDKSEEIA